MRIEWRHTHQSVHSILTLKIAIGIFTSLYLHRHALDTGFVALLQVADGHLMSVSLSPPLIHTHEHGSPVLTLCTTSATVDFQHTVHRVFLLPQHVHEFEVLDGSDGTLIISIHLLFGNHLILIEVESQLKFIGQQSHLCVAINPFFDALHLFHLFLSALGVIPEIGSLCAEVLLFIFNLLFVYIQIAVELFGALQYVLQLVLSDHISVLLILHTSFLSLLCSWH